jgi:hypothetical protein
LVGIPVVAFLAVGALVVVGLGMIAFGIVALRDEPPRWMLRFKHPGRVLALGLVTLVVAFIVNTLRYDIAEDVANYVGHPVSCEKIGELEIEGERRLVYSCIAPQNHDAHIGCFARVGDGVLDVSTQAKAPGAFAGKTPDC